MKIRGLRFAYGPHLVFDSFSWDSRGQVTALGGPSGCGKSTLLRLLAGDLTPQAADEFPDTAGTFLVLQEDGLFPWLTGVENISTLLRWPRERIIDDPLFRLVAGFADTPACNLSYGQRRAIELTRALMARPQQLLLDEPFNFLDPKRRAEYARELRKASSSGSRVLLSTHYMDDAKDLADDTYIFSGELPVSSLERA